MAGRASSLDAAEVAKFGSLGADWWDEEGPMRALHRINPLRIAWVRDLIVARLPATGGGRRDVDSGLPLRGLRLLDVGCGAGLLSEPMARLGAQVVGVDPAQKNIETARAHAEEFGLEIDYRAAEAQELVAAGETFDIVLAMEVIEHVPSPTAFMSTLCKLVAPEGLVFLSTLNRTLKSYLLGIVAAEFILHWTPRGAHRWEKFVSPEEIRRWLHENDLRVLAQTGLVFNPLSARWRLSRDMDVNFMMAASRAAR